MEGLDIDAAAQLLRLLRWPWPPSNGVTRTTCPPTRAKGFDGLSALVSLRLGRDPPEWHVYLFLSCDRVRAKVLHVDGTGLCIYAK